MQKLTRQEVQVFLEIAADSFPHNVCLTCECFLGYVTQLHVDSDQASNDLTESYRRDRKDTHRCLGCDPCPPGNLYAEYIRNRPRPPLITL